MNAASQCDVYVQMHHCVPDTPCAGGARQAHITQITSDLRVTAVHLLGAPIAE